MKGICKKAVTVLMAFALIVTSICTGNPLKAKAASSSWNFKDNGFKSLGTISSTVTVDGLSLIATSAKTMTIAANSQTVDGAAYTYALSLGGGGSTTYRAVKVPVSGTGTLKVTCKSSGSSARTLAVVNASGTKLGEVTADVTAKTQTFAITSSTEYVYLYSTGSNIDLFKIQVDSSNNNTTTNDTTNTSDGKTVTSYSALVSAIVAAEKAGGGNVYVSGSSISCSGQVLLSASNANVCIIGVKNSDGTYPVLDFSAFRSAYIGKATKDDQVGVRITGSKYTVKNLIIQKAPDNGIQIKGSGAGNNKVENCIVRYNNDAGVQITGGAYNNVIGFVYSYRNCDVYTLGGNADGFAPKLGAGKGNSFYGCYAWENSDDGWDSFDKDTLTYDLSYEQCATWNNGDSSIFTGEYDYKKGNALDKDLLLVELIMKQDSSFASNYSNKKFSLPTASFLNVTNNEVLSVSGWLSKYDGNPNGFKFGSANTTSACLRTVKNCLSFGHGKKGFDNNNGAASATFANTVSFDNGYNYYIPKFTVKSASNMLGFSGKSSDNVPSGTSISTPATSKQFSIRSTVNATVNTITTNCKKNIIPGEVYFNIY